MAIIEDERTFSDMDTKAAPTGADLLQIADMADGGRVKKIPISSILSQDGTDTNAIHVDVAAEIAGVTAKAAPTVNDLAVIEDAAAANVKKRIVLGAIMKAVGWIAGLTAKATPVGADLIAVEDSAAAGAIKKVALSALFLITNRKTIVFTRVNVVGATASVYRYQNVSGNSETVLKIGSALSAALATGDATITASIDGVAVTDGVVTIAQVGSAAGTKDTATPSAANVIADGASLELTVGGANDAAVFADVSVELSY